MGYGEIIGMILGGVGKRVDAGLQYDAAKKQLWSETQAARRNLEANAQLAEGAAVDAQRRGDLEAAKVRSAATQFRSEQQVAATASGLDPTSSSIQATMEGTQQLAQVDILTAENNAARAAWGYETKAEMLRQRSAEVLANAAQTNQSLDLGLVLSMVTPAQGTISQVGSLLNGIGGNDQQKDPTYQDQSGATPTGTYQAQRQGSEMQSQSDSGGGAPSGTYDDNIGSSSSGLTSREFYQYDLQGRPRIKRG